MWHSINFFTLFVLFHHVNSFEYGQPCLATNPDSCNKTNLLECIRIDPTNSKCSCISGVLDLGYGCTEYAKNIGDSCAEHNDICAKLSESECLGNICACNIQTHVIDNSKTKCLTYCRQMNETCDIGASSNHCEQIGQGVICVGTPNLATCDCDTMNEYSLHPNGNGCLKYAAGLGSPCLQGSRQCERIEGAECSTSGVCSCKISHVTNPNGESCHPYQQSLGGYCIPGTTPEQCYPRNSECTNVFFCGCSPGYVINGNECILPTIDTGSPSPSTMTMTSTTTIATTTTNTSGLKIWDNCENSDECINSISGPVACTRGQCTCQLASYPSQDLYTCSGANNFSISIILILALFYFSSVIKF